MLSRAEIEKIVRTAMHRLYGGAKTVRFAMLATYMAVTLVTIILMSVYIVQIMSENMYSEKNIKLFAKANMISQAVENSWDFQDSTTNYLRVEDIVSRSLAGTDIRGVVTDSSFNVIYDTNREANMLGKVFVRGVLKRAIDGEQADASYESDGGKMIAVAVPLYRNGTVSGGIYLAENVQTVQTNVDAMRRSLWLFGVLLIFVTIMLSVGLSYIITHPFEQFICVANAISRGDFTKRASVRGMSEMAQLGRTLNYMCDELSLLDEKRKNFVSDVSHELKTPMATIKLLCDTLVSAENPSIEMIREYLSDMSSEIDRLTRLVDKLLELSRLDAGANICKSEFDITEMCAFIVHGLDTLAKEKDITIKYFYNSGNNRNITADYDKLYEVVYNLVNNAVKYTPEHGTVILRLNNTAERCIIEVEDNGPGIPDEEKTKIFDRFYRIDAARARDTGGTGLGLAIAKEAIRLHSGTIEVSDAESGGSLFRIELPN